MCNLLSAPLVLLWSFPMQFAPRLCSSNRINLPPPLRWDHPQSAGWIHLNVLLWPPLRPIFQIIPVAKGVEAIETPLKHPLNCQSRHVVVLFSVLIFSFSFLCLYCSVSLCHSVWINDAATLCFRIIMYLWNFILKEKHWTKNSFPCSDILKRYMGIKNKWRKEIPFIYLFLKILHNTAYLIE